MPQKEMQSMAKRKNKDAKKADEVQQVEETTVVLSVDEAASQMQEDAPQEITAEGLEVKTSDLKMSRATADCMHAKEESCSCRCRGKYHGKEHPKGWKDEEGCEPLNEQEKKAAKKAALYSWRKAHPERVSAYMKAWRAEKKAQEASEEETDQEAVSAEAEGE